MEDNQIVNIPKWLPLLETISFKEAINPFYFTILHQVWLSKNVMRPNHMFHQENQKKWSLLNPEIKYKLWNYDDVIDLIHNYYTPKTLTCFLNLEPFICKCDFARLLIVYQFGGLYTDVDFIPIVPIRNWCPIYDESGFLLFNELSEHSTTQLCNGFFGSEFPQHMFLGKLIDHITNNKTQKDAFHLTGPRLWKDIHDIYFKDIIIQNGSYVMPLTDKGKLSQDFTGDSSCWAYTDWHTGSGWGNGITFRNITMDKTNTISLTTSNQVDIYYILSILFTCLSVLTVLLEIIFKLYERKRFTGSPASLQTQILGPLFVGNTLKLEGSDGLVFTGLST
jgi:mannosyltransferase OCH1-like enzyme